MIDRDHGWLQTFTGRRFWPLAPRPEDVCIEDIAHALSMICRYNGHTRTFYSVAEHSLLVATAVERYVPSDSYQQLQALLHDAAEAYLCDIVRPIKPALVGYQAAEDRVDLAIGIALGVAIAPKTELIAQCDRRILCDEAQALMHIELEPNAWWRNGPALDVQIVGLRPDIAERLFLERYHRLGGGHVHHERWVDNLDLV
jgi:hypothetical protein